MPAVDKMVTVKILSIDIKLISSLDQLIKNGFRPVFVPVFPEYLNTDRGKEKLTKLEYLDRLVHCVVVTFVYIKALQNHPLPISLF